MKNEKYNLSLKEVSICTIIACIILFALFVPRKVKASKTTMLHEASKMIERHEGYSDIVYTDTRGNSTIGIGFNLDKYNARERIEEVGANYHSILMGNSRLCDSQIRSLFQDDLQIALADAKRFLPNFDQQPKDIQMVIVDMSYNMGLGSLNTFVKFRKALMDRDYLKAANEMLDSRWYHQVGNRSDELVHIVAMQSL